VDKGALLVQIPRGPASNAGLEAGDIIVAIDGKEIDGMETLRKIVMKKKVGEKLKIRLLRQDDVFETYLKLQEAP
jgi:S1-C subfamily serine protease